MNLYPSAYHSSVLFAPLRELVPPTHGFLNSDSSRPMGTIDPSMEGLFPAHPLLDAALARLVGLARQRNPFGVTPQGVEARLPWIQSNLHPSVEPKLRNGRHSPSPLPRTLSL